ncbi:MAG: DUF1559 domain-containing protein [Gemmataceae bacterium]
MIRSSNHGARALPEALVVVGLLAILLGLFLPGIRHLRESSARESCRDHLRRLAAACMQAEDVHGRLPPGFRGARPGELDTDDRRTGLLVELLPYLGRADLATRLPSEGQWYGGDVYPPPSYAVAATRVPEFECPSAAGARGRSALIVAAFGHDAAGAATFGRWIENYVHAEAYRPFAPSHYAGVGGAGRGPHAVASRYVGVFTDRTGVALADVAAGDGLSSTLLIGESCGQRQNRPPEGRPSEPPDECDANWVGVGALPTAHGLGEGTDSEWRQFGSCHAGVVQFALCDGSVRALRMGQTRRRPSGDAVWANFGAGSSDWQLLQALAGYRDATAFDGSLFVD